MHIIKPLWLTHGGTIPWDGAYETRRNRVDRAAYILQHEEEADERRKQAKRKISRFTVAMSLQMANGWSLRPEVRHPTTKAGIPIV